MGKLVTEIQSESTTIGKCKVVLVAPSDVSYVWDDVVPLLDKALQYSEGEMTSDDLAPHLDNENLRMWVAMKGNEIIACMVTEVIEYPRKKIVRVITLAGKDMDLWYDFLPLVEGYAVKQGCSALEAWTRKGMTRKLKDWKHSYDIITKDIKQRMQ
jgi:hypothetical protein|tara:strand:- start:467 stop:934 length:468 start_codon:yes stop_codon:yes gene_type:complete